MHTPPEKLHYLLLHLSNLVLGGFGVGLQQVGPVHGRGVPEVGLGELRMVPVCVRVGVGGVRVCVCVCVVRLKHILID